MNVVIETESPTWLAVKQLVEARIAELTGEVLSTATEDRARSDAVQRIDELKLLLDAPAEIVRRALSAAQDKRSTY